MFWSIRQISLFYFPNLSKLHLTKWEKGIPDNMQTGPMMVVLTAKH